MRRCTRTALQHVSASTAAFHYWALDAIQGFGASCCAIWDKVCNAFARGRLHREALPEWSFAHELYLHPWVAADQCGARHLISNGHKAVLGQSEGIQKFEKQLASWAPTCGQAAGKDMAMKLRSEHRLILKAKLHRFLHGCTASQGMYLDPNSM